MVCVETSSGRKVWSQELVTDLGGRGTSLRGYTESPLVDGDLVIVAPGGEYGAIAAFDKKKGTLKWRPHPPWDVGQTSIIAIEVNGVRQYVRSLDGKVVGLRASDGKPLWEQNR